MSATPNPVRCARPMTPDVAGERRHVGCRRVLECLTIAGKAGWPGFTCASCAVVDREELPITIGLRGIDASRPA